MFMIKSNLSFESVKRAVEALFNQKVKITQNLGRNKFVSYQGVVSGVYPALFTITPDLPNNFKTSFSYAEVICGDVKISTKQEKRG